MQSEQAFVMRDNRWFAFGGVVQKILTANKWREATAYCGCFQKNPTPHAVWLHCCVGTLCRQREDFECEAGKIWRAGPSVEGAKVFDCKVGRTFFACVSLHLCVKSEGKERDMRWVCSNGACGGGLGVNAYTKSHRKKRGRRRRMKQLASKLHRQQTREREPDA